MVPQSEEQNIFFPKVSWVNNKGMKLSVELWAWITGVGWAEEIYELDNRVEDDV